MQCNKCRRNAVFFQEYSGLHLCEQHFEADVEAKAKHEIRRYRWMIPGDHIAVALSGNLNSSALLFFLKKLTANRRDIRISAITLDDGIGGYRDPVYAMRIAQLMDTECITGSFHEDFGITVDEIAHTKGTSYACIYCRVLRNFLLNRIAREHGITKLAIGNTLDDCAVVVLKNILQGNPGILMSRRNVRGKIPRITPFLSIPCNEVELYAHLHIKQYDQSRCPYNNKPFEKDVQEMLRVLTIRHPATKYALRSLEKNLACGCMSMADSVSSCEQCGEPADGLCQSCRIINEVTANGT